MVRHGKNFENQWQFLHHYGIANTFGLQNFKRFRFLKNSLFLLNVFRLNHNKLWQFQLLKHSMKKYILLALGSAVFLACSPRKDGYLNRKYQGFTTFYNVLFNGEEALNAELKQRDKSYRDNFHAPYIKLLTYEEQISSAQMENLGVSDNEEGVAPEDFFTEDDTETGALFQYWS